MTADHLQQQKFIDTSFARTTFIECGAGPVALFLHGLPLNCYEWRAVIADLAALRREVVWPAHHPELASPIDCYSA